jgi:hypothetical protein
MESSFLIEKWLMKAFRGGFDIIELLNSNIVATKLNHSNVEHWNSWSKFDHSTSSASYNYDQEFQALLHDEKAYDYLFGKEFPKPVITLDFNMHNTYVTDEHFSWYPITYIAERIPFRINSSPETRLDAYEECIFELFEILAETEELRYFQCGFVRRLIDWKWDSQMVKFYYIASALYMLSYILIVSSSVALRWYDTDPFESSRFRAVLLTINLVILSIGLVTYEVRSMITDKFDYIKDLWNLNDVTLFIMSIITLIMEYQNLSY